MSALDYRLERHTSEQCNHDLCEYCGCCAHGSKRAKGCKVEDAPAGMRCPEDYCNCEGRA